MNFKQIAAIAICIIGVMLAGCALHSMSQIETAKSAVHIITTPFSGSPVGKEVGQSLTGRLSQYDLPVKICLFGGIALAIGGLVAAIAFRKKA
jgi:hypothetical protein